MKKAIFIIFFILNSIFLYSQDAYFDKEFFQTIHQFSDTTLTDKKALVVKMLVRNYTPAAIKLLNDSSENNALDAQKAIKFVTNFVKDNENFNKIIASNLCEGLENTKIDSVKLFLLENLNIVAQDEHISIIKNFLKDEKFARQAAEVLKNIYTANAADEILKEMIQKTGDLKAFYIKILGEMRYDKANDYIFKLINDPDIKIKKESLFALSQIADENSKIVLKNAAKSVNYMPDDSEATKAYLNYISKAEDQTLATELLRELAASQNFELKSLLLLLVAEKNPADFESFFSDALKSTSKNYRLTALEIATSSMDNNFYSILLNLAKKEKKIELKAEILQALGSIYNARNFAHNELPDYFSSLTSAETQIRLAILPTFIKFGEDIQNVNKVLEILKTEDDNLLQNCYIELQKFSTESLVEPCERSLENATDKMKVVLVKLLSFCKSKSSFDKILPLLSTKNKELRIVSLYALAETASDKHTETLKTLLDSTYEPTDFPILQRAIYNSLRRFNNYEKTYRVQKLRESVDNRDRFLPIFAMIGGENALQPVLSDYENAEKTALAFDVLCNFVDDAANDKLFEIAADKKSKFSSKALTSYIQHIEKSEVFVKEMKLIALEKALEIASAEQKSEVSAAIERISKQK